MKKAYRQPSLTEFGRVEALTLGATGPKFDFIFDPGLQFKTVIANSCTSNTNPGCTTILS